MNSLFAKILLWFWCTVAVYVVGSAFISALNVSRNASSDEAPVARLVTFQLEEARTAYETGGRPALQAFMDTLGKVYGAHGILTDEHGRDLLTNRNRSDLVARAMRHPKLPTIQVDSDTVARVADDGRYWFFYEVPKRRIGIWFLSPDHMFFMLAGVLLCYWLALHLTSPVRALQKAVERFGAGDLRARVGSTRRDELGQLARTFDRMANRIETLLAAERRLLLDISHELRSPLARLGVAIELARSGENLDAHLGRIQKESDRLNLLVGELLQVTRAEGDPNSLRRDPIRLDELVAQLVDDAQIEASAHGCALEYARHEPVTVEGDPELLRRAVENVIRNAIRYSPPREPVEVSLARQNGSAVVDVRDRGPGVPAAEREQIFRRFWRRDRRRQGSAGLGLSIVARIAEQHGGQVSVADRSGGGATFTLSFPTVIAARDTAQHEFVPAS